MFEEHPGRPWKIADDAMSAGQKALVEHVLSGFRPAMPPNLSIWLHHLPFAQVAEPFGAYVLRDAAFTPRQKEIVILAVAAHHGSAFEQHFHEAAARRHGLADAQVAALRERRDPGFDDPIEAVSLALVHAMLDAHDVPDALHARAMAVLGHRGVHDVIALAGLYTMIAWTLSFYRVPVPRTPAAPR